MLHELKAYYTSLIAPRRLPTQEVPIGDVPVGGKNPIRLQTMTTADTLNISAVVEEVIRLAEAGAEYVLSLIHI